MRAKPIVCCVLLASGVMLSGQPILASADPPTAPRTATDPASRTAPEKAAIPDQPRSGETMDHQRMMTGQDMNQHDARGCSCGCGMMSGSHMVSMWIFGILLVLLLGSGTAALVALTVYLWRRAHGHFD